MNSNPPPLPSTGSSFPWRFGCIAVLVLFVCLIIAAVLGARHAIVKTALPFKAFAAFVESANPNVKITGISGDLSTGPSVASITWGDDPQKRSEILDLRVKYNGFRDARLNNQVIIEDVGVRKAHIDIADFGTLTKTTTTSSTSGTSAGPSSGSGSLLATTLDRFEIKRVLIEDVLITNRHTDFRLSIPKISWTGFVATQKTVEPGEIIIESDRLNMHSGSGQTLPIADASVTFQKVITGTAQPLLHSAIRQPISFALNFTVVPEVKMPAFHFSTADAKLEIATTVDGGQALHISGLDLGAFIDVKKIYGAQAADLPSELVLEAVNAPEGGGPLKIVSGWFRLGTAKFDIEPAEITKDQSATAKLQAVWNSDVGEVRWSVPLEKIFTEFRPLLTSTADLPPTEILARVFAGKPYAELSIEERRGIDLRIPVYFAADPQ